MDTKLHQNPLDGPYAPTVVEVPADLIIGVNVYISAFNVTFGKGVVLENHVVIKGNTTIGDNTIIESGVRIGDGNEIPPNRRVPAGTDLPNNWSAAHEHPETTLPHIH